MRVCIISSWFPTTNNPTLGSFVYNYAKYLARSGVSVHIITVLGKGDQKKQLQDSMTIYRIPQAKFPLVSILSLARKIKPDIIHVHAPNVFSSNAIVVAKLLKVPILATVHRAELEPINKLLFYHLRKIALRQFKSIVAVSHFSKALAIKAGADKRKLFVIHNSCDETQFFARDALKARVALGLPPDKKIILFVGNLTKRKGVHTLISALGSVRTAFPNFMAIIIGKGEEENNLRLSITKNDLGSWVELRGWCSEEELPYYYSSADVFILPSTMEGHSVALIEAMASGLSIVASDIEGNRESVQDQVNGFLFSSGDDKMLAEKLISILGDDELRKRFSAQNVESYSKKFSARAHIEKYMEVYKTLLKDERPRAAV